MKPAIWRLEELVERAADSLAQEASPGDSRRVRWLPDARTARFYTTIGLLDRPVEMRGRTAYYGPRHLRQLVAIKRLQAEGLPLAEVQRRLAGIPDEELRALAPLSDSLVSKERGPAAPVRARAFWSESAAPPELGACHGAGALEADGERPASRAAAVHLAPGATLVLGVDPRALDDAKLAALARAAAALVDELRELGLIPGPSSPGAAGQTRKEPKP